MKTVHALFLSGCFILLLSCQSTGKKTGEFRLLPQPQHVEITGTSALSVDDIRYYFAPDGTGLSVTGDLLKKIQPAKKERQAQILFRMDKSVDLQAEGYTLDISNRQITITGKRLGF